MVYKVGMVWPLEPQGLADFTLGLDLVVVVEEKQRRYGKHSSRKSCMAPMLPA
ncbi:MAG: hypothetical protein R3E56_06730 [Burkholderiaceae bacterium]